ncbi:MAG: hypothetical protein EP347_10565 [Alphaproteobacteria bacterium]|nr:MAG: hypothetical protein EP347_10565 [Alphaproteobacteria bacterium]
MEETIFQLFHATSAIPFGFLFLSIFWLSITFAGIIGTIAAFFRRKHRLSLALGSILLLAMSGLLATAEVFSATYLDMNPRVTDEELQGTWLDGNSVITLHDDLSATLELSKSNQRKLDFHSNVATWYRATDFSIILEAPNTAGTHEIVEMRIIGFKDQLYLTKEFDDPDMWDSNLGFKKRSLSE